jgi:geranylgeranyl reductase family protein
VTGRKESNAGTRDYDVAIVGAGPAGATAALYARRHGLRVALFDRRRFPRDKICGDAVARKSLGYLRDLGLLDDVRAEVHEPIGAAVLSAPGGNTIRVDLNPHDAPEQPHLVCRRALFDDVLVRAARRSVDVFEECPVRDVARSSGAVTGVRFREPGGGEREVSARLVVGADGYNSVVARSLGLYRHDGRRWWVGTRAYYRDLAVAPNTVEVHYVGETLPGFLWMFPTGDGVVNVGLGMIHDDVKRRGRSIREVHETVVSSARFRERFASARPIDGVRGWHLPTPDRTRTIHGDGFLLAGDAAGLVDPFSGEGIGNAMCSGEVAARIATGPSATASYPALLWEAIDGGEIDLHYRLRALARRRRLLDFLVGRAAAHRDVLDWIMGMTSERGAVERKRALTSPLTYLRLLFRGR